MTTIFLKMLLETFKALAGKILFQVVSERFMSRIICFGLRKISEQSTNNLTRAMAEEIINGLKRSDLPEIK